MITFCESFGFLLFFVLVWLWVFFFLFSVEGEVCEKYRGSIKTHPKQAGECDSEESSEPGSFLEKS